MCRVRRTTGGLNVISECPMVPSNGVKPVMIEGSIPIDIPGSSANFLNASHYPVTLTPYPVTAFY
jgi:hypothetical protein